MDPQFDQLLQVRGQTQGWNASTGLSHLLGNWQVSILLTGRSLVILTSPTYTPPETNIVTNVASFNIVFLPSKFLLTEI